MRNPGIPGRSLFIMFWVTLENRERAWAYWKKACDLGACNDCTAAKEEDVFP